MSRATRRNRTREDVARLLHSYDSSGLTQADFARGNRISISTLRYWLRRRRDEGPVRTSAPALIPVTLRPTLGAVSARIEVALANGRTLRLPIDTDAGRVADLAAALEA
jgi:transposase-like protein